MRYTIFNAPIISRVARVLSKAILKIIGWRVVGEVPQGIKKFVAVTAPHTSNWDFLIFLMTTFILRLDAHWMGKDTLFHFPFRGFMTWLGGIPVNRKVKGNMVAKATEMFLANEAFAIGIAPEGTRKATGEWKKGFWYIAQSAHVPIMLAFIDYKAKECGIGAEFCPSDSVHDDMTCIKHYYTQFEGKHPENFRI